MCAFLKGQILESVSVGWGAVDWCKPLLRKLITQCALPYRLLPSMRGRSQPGVAIALELQGEGRCSYYRDERVKH